MERPDTQMIADNAARVYNQVVEAEKRDRENVKKLFGIGIFEAPAEEKMDIHMDTE
jgi:hypothetical protein